MATKQDREVRLRLVVREPVAGVVHSLQDKANAPVDPQASTDGADLAFTFSIRIAASASGLRFLGDFVRREGPLRRFVYLAIGKHAGDAMSPWDRRMKLDVHTIPPALVEAAARGGMIEGVVCGRGKDGSPACATVALAVPWRFVPPSR